MSDYPLKLMFILFLILLYGCSQRSTSIESAVICSKIEEKGIEYPVTQKDQPNFKSAFQVAALSFTASSNSILIAHISLSENLGRVTELSVPALQVINSFTINELSPQFTHFSKGGRLIISAAKTECPDLPYTKNSTCQQVKVWETSSGRLWWMPTTASVDLHDLAISDDGKWVLRVKPATGISSTEDKLAGANFSFTTQEVEREAVAGAFNSTGGLFALGLKNRPYDSKKTSGSIRLQTWDGRVNRDPISLDLGLFQFTTREAILAQPPQRLTFDAGSRWLGVEMQDSIQVYNVQSLAKYAEADLKDVRLGTMTFDTKGKFLAVGYPQGFKVLTVPDLKVVLDRPTKEAVTSITFSPNGCLLAWGDVEGTVHIINAPKP